MTLCSTRRALTAALFVAIGPASADARPDALLVGVLAEQAVRRCDEHGNARWHDRHYEIGFTYLRASPRLGGLARHAHRPVVAFGEAALRPTVRAPTGHPCPLAQMRSNWEIGLHGMRMRRAPGSGIAAFAAHRVRPFDGLTLARRGVDGIEVALRNTLGRPLRQVELVMHYEGCGGKPSSAQRIHSVAALAPGRSTRVVLPTLVHHRARSGDHRASSLSLRAAGDRVLFDFDLLLSRARPPVVVPCPRTGGRRR